MPKKLTRKQIIELIEKRIPELRDLRIEQYAEERTRAEVTLGMITAYRVMYEWMTGDFYTD